jgi:hypothetical protein
VGERKRGVTDGWVRGSSKHKTCWQVGPGHQPGKETSRWGLEEINFLFLFQKCRNSVIGPKIVRDIGKINKNSWR